MARPLPWSTLWAPSIAWVCPVLPLRMSKLIALHWRTSNIFHLSKLSVLGRPWWLSDTEPTSQCRRRRFDPRSGNIPHATEQLSPCTTTIAPVLQSLVRESIPRQVDKKSSGPQGERGLEFSRRNKGQMFFFLYISLGLYNNNVSCLRTVSGKNLLANPVFLKYQLWEWV